MTTQIHCDNGHGYLAPANTTCSTCAEEAIKQLETELEKARGYAERLFLSVHNE